MDIDEEADHRARKRSKVDIACDACRQRKTRCDGKRPTCSLCEAGYRICVYRNPSDAIGLDGDAFKRLTDLEKRLRALETSASTSHQNGSGTQPRPGISATPIYSVPRLHTAAAHKLLHCWPRLGVKFTHPYIEPLQYLRDADHQDGRFEHTLDPFPSYIQLRSSIEDLRRLDEVITEVPVAIGFLLLSSPLFSTDAIVAAVGDFPDQSDIHVVQLPVCGLLKLVVATMRKCGDSDGEGGQRRIAQSCLVLFRHALQNSWKLHAVPAETQIPALLLLACIHVYVFSLPFHALGVLRNVASLLDNSQFQYVHYVIGISVLARQTTN